MKLSGSRVGHEARSVLQTSRCVSYLNIFQMLKRTRKLDGGSTFCCERRKKGSPNLFYTTAMNPNPNNVLVSRGIEPFQPKLTGHAACISDVASVVSFQIIMHCTCTIFSTPVWLFPTRQVARARHLSMLCCSSICLISMDVDVANGFHF